jgi:5,5'-dehydrodivanillate O-demethylase
VEGDCIRCLYHGWKYDGTGQCVEQPGEDVSFATKVTIRSYPVQEYLGLIFAYLGEGEVPALRRYPDFEQPGLLMTLPPERWPCNYYNRLDNDADGGHVLYTHWESTSRVGTLERYRNREITSELTEYGVRVGSTRGGGLVEYLHCHMPNVNQIRVKSGAASGTSANLIVEDRMTWAVPIDDASSLRFEINLVHLSGEAAEAHRQRAEALLATVRPANEWGDQILAGKLTIRGLPRDMSTYQLFRIEDYVTQVGQGQSVAHAQDRLGRIDSGVVLRRKLWLRELAALKQGRPLTEWRIPEGLAEMTPDVMYAGG